MDSTGPIESAEKKFKQILEDFFISVYPEETLISHGIDHHRRVWNYSKKLLELIPSENSEFKAKLCSELIIASYLHDIGMSVDPGIKHGVHSRDICVQFLIQNHIHENDWQNVLDAIENHDNKDYTGNTPLNELLTILSVADDLDAFGYTGIFRYSEIYLARGIDPGKIGFMIRENAEKRFNNFTSSFGSYSDIVEKHKKRYKILDDFFSKYNEQLPSYHFGSLNYSGYCGVVETFVFMINNEIGLEEIYQHSKKYMVDPIIYWYFSELERELIIV